MTSRMGIAVVLHGVWGVRRRAGATRVDRRAGRALYWISKPSVIQGSRRGFALWPC